MAKKKLTLSELKVESCINSLSTDQMDKVKGGAVTVIKGRTHNYIIRWTAVDTRAQTDLNTPMTQPGSGTH